jgi:hypothetical protein
MKKQFSILLSEAAAEVEAILVVEAELAVC